jgi:AcrR family transcriptional regulator
MTKENDVREQIIQAATAVYKKWGFVKTTMEDIAYEAGKGKATLYYYFKSKEEVFASVLKEQIQEISFSIHSKLKDVESASDRLRKYFIMMYEESIHRVEVFSVLKMDVRKDKNLISNLREIIESSELSSIREIIKFGIDHGEFLAFTESEINDIAMTISTSIRPLIINPLLLEDNPEEAERLDTISNFFVRGLKK